MPDDESSKNPFIKWKNHVDTQISTTLQGIVGLPSAISRNLNQRWPEIEEARRKEQGMQQQQEQSQSQASADNHHEEPLSPTPTDLEGTSCTDASPTASSGPRRLALGFFSRDQCPRAHGKSGSWWGSNQMGPNNSGDDPDCWTSWPDWVQLARWHSFAAYSPYSPLNLRSMPQPRPCDLPAGESSTLTFEDAFEDLLAVMCGKDIVSLKERAEMRRILDNMFPSGEPGFYWVRRLQSQNLLSGYFPRAEQVRQQLEKKFESEEEARRQRELDERRGRMWKRVWSRHHPMGRSESRSDSDAKSFEEWDIEDWAQEMDSILSQAAKDVRDELNNPAHIFGELERIFKNIGKVGETLAGFGMEHKEQSQSRTSQEDEETEEDHFSAVARASGSASASAEASTSFSTSESRNPFDTWSQMMNSRSRGVASEEKHSNSGPFQNTSTEETVDPETGIRTIKTTETKVDKKGNRTSRTKVQRLNSHGEEISCQTSYSKSMSSSWSWSSGGSSSDDEDKCTRNTRSQSPSSSTGEGGEKRTGWFWR